MFTPGIFTCPPQGMKNNVVALLSNVISPKEVVAAKVDVAVPAAYMVTDIVKNRSLVRTFDTTHLL